MSSISKKLPKEMIEDLKKIVEKEVSSPDYNVRAVASTLTLLLGHIEILEEELLRKFTTIKVEYEGGQFIVDRKELDRIFSWQHGEKENICVEGVYLTANLGYDKEDFRKAYEQMKEKELGESEKYCPQMTKEDKNSQSPERPRVNTNTPLTQGKCGPYMTKEEFEEMPEHERPH